MLVTVLLKNKHHHGILTATTFTVPLNSLTASRFSLSYVSFYLVVCTRTAEPEFKFQP